MDAKNQSKQDSETVQIITKDLIRHLRIPLKDPSGVFMVLPSAEYKRIVSVSQVLTKEERKKLMEASRRKKEEEIRVAQDRKHQIHEADLAIREKQELQSQADAQCSVEQDFRAEQEEEIRKLNTLILGAQCQAARDTQITERKQIQTELSEEEKRLDNMMEEERLRALETMEQSDELRKRRRMSGMQEIYNQILQRLEEKQLLEEMKEQEKQQIQEKQETINLEDQKALEKKRDEQQQLQKEIMRINAETMQAKKQRQEEEKRADMRIMEYIQNKLEQEAAYEAEQNRIKKEKELEITRMRAQQQRAKDYIAMQDEIRMRRNQEVADREWRKKEKDLAAKKVREEEMLRVARLEQVHCKEHFLAIEAAREKAEVKQMLKAQEEVIKRLKEEEGKHHKNAKLHAEALRHQVKEREISAVAKRREILKEAEDLILEAQQRRVRLDEIKEKKLKALKATGLSEKYCSEVERKARVCLL
ncbi:cilia- and flagella-associated protein 45 isoform X3 [Xyrichtys novacula]|nr:cilia- and flagella-associated protein 45 isoform X3 [Xyrichtys novacula]